jgi:hypothetical protein
MPIAFKSKLSSSVANATFLDKTIDDLKKGVLGLYKVSPSEADAVDDVQVFLNEQADVSGIAGEGDATAKTYSSEEIIDNGDDRKVAIGKLDAQVKINLDTNNTQNTLITNNTRLVVANEAIAASGEISKSDDIYNQVRRVSGDGAAVTASTTPFGNVSAPSDGTIIILRGTDNTNTITITNQDIQYGCILNGDATLANYFELELMYDAVAERYIEQRRNF